MDGHFGATVTPVIAETADGQEQVVDFAIDSAVGGTATQMEDMYVDEFGEYHHQFEDIELDDEFDEIDYEETGVDMIVDSVFELYPNYEDVTAWAAQYYPAEVIEQFNYACDETGDFDVIMPFIEAMMEEFIANGGELEEPEYEYESDDDDYDYRPGIFDESPWEYESTEDWFDTISDEVIDNTLDTVYDLDFTDGDAGLITEAYESLDTDSIESEMLQGALYVYQGELTMNDLVEHFISEYGDADAAAGYYNTMTLLQELTQ